MKRYALRASHIRASVVIAATVLMAYCVNALKQSPEERAESQARTRLIEAQVRCEHLVRDRLKSPSTAKFGTPTPQLLGSNRYRVAGHYDAQNSFGAMLRGRYVCELRRDGENWRLVSLVLP